jgi:hypothetical protein
MRSAWIALALVVSPAAFADEPDPHREMAKALEAQLDAPTPASFPEYSSAEGKSRLDATALGRRGPVDRSGGPDTVGRAAARALVREAVGGELRALRRAIDAALQNAAGQAASQTAHDHGAHGHGDPRPVPRSQPH